MSKFEIGDVVRIIDVGSCYETVKRYLPIKYHDRYYEHISPREGAFGTIVDNVEILSNSAWIVLVGATFYVFEQSGLEFVSSKNKEELSIDEFRLKYARILTDRSTSVRLGIDRITVHHNKEIYDCQNYQELRKIMDALNFLAECAVQTRKNRTEDRSETCEGQL